MRPEPRRDVQEIRQHRRVDLHVEITLESESNFYAGVSNNVSEGGVFVATHAAPPVGATVTLSLSLPGTGRFALAGVVRWVREDEVCHGSVPGCGIQWTELPPDARMAIERFVRSRDTELYDVG
jgi:uncharacterized protein (TIGR02266 family)